MQFDRSIGRQKTPVIHSCIGGNWASYVGKSLVAACVLALWTYPAHATLPYSKETGKKCYYCHANQIGEESVLTEQGEYWISHNKSFDGMPAELVPGPPPPVKVKNTPIVGIIVGSAFFVGIIAMIIVGIFKKPVVQPAYAAKETESGEPHDTGGSSK